MVSIAFNKFTLTNGLQVVLHQDRALPFVSVNIWYHVGSKDESPGRTGFAHLFEHLMFEGSKNHDELFFNPLQKIGGSVNGSTTSDRTNYWENVPSEYLELALWLESDRMGFLLESLDQEKLDLQRDVVKNERRQSYENRPYGMSHLILQPKLFPSPHPYSWPVIGSQEDLDAASLEDVKSFFSRFYSPTNASLAIAGDFEEEEAKSLVEQYFGDIEGASNVTRLEKMDSSLKGETDLRVFDNVHLPRYSLVWPSTPAFDSFEAPLDILATVLADGKSSRLYQSLVYKKQIAKDVSVYNYAREIAGEFSVEVTGNSEDCLPEIQDVLEAELFKIKDEDILEEELQRAKNRIESQHLKQLEKMGGFSGRADQLNYYNVMAGDPNLINLDIERYSQVTVADIRHAADKVLGPNRVRMQVVSENKTLSVPTSIDRAVMPKSRSTSSFDPPIPKSNRLSNGMEVLFVSKSNIPITVIGLMIRGGSATDPSDLPGLSQITTAMLAEGTSKRSSKQIAKEMEFLGSNLNVSTGRENVFISAQTPSRSWMTALDIIADIVRNPVFPDDELARIRKEKIADVESISDDAATMSQIAIRSLLYGSNSPYGHSALGTKQSLQQIDKSRIIEYYSSNFGPKKATLIVVGDVDESSVMESAENKFGDWNIDTLDADPLNLVSPSLEASTIYLLDRPEAPQSVIKAGHITIPRNHSDYLPLYLINYVFGAHPTARLFMNLRQDKGYSYGYYSNIDWLSGPSAIVAGGSVQTAVTKESLIETIKEFSDIRGGRPITAEELEEGKQGILRSFPSQFETKAQMLGCLSSIVSFGLPLDYFNTLTSSIMSLDLASVAEVAENRIQDKSLSVLIVGDKKVVAPTLKGLGYSIIDIDLYGRQVE